MRFSRILIGSTMTAALLSVATGKAVAAPSKIDISHSPSPAVTMRATEFHFLDLDHDGYITLGDISDPVTRSQFPSLDRNHDHRLSEAEFVSST